MNASPKSPNLDFQQLQRQFAAHIRDPDAEPRPDGVEDRRMAIYRDLFFNNVSGLLATNFPVLRKILSDEHWHQIIRDFFARHRCQTPHFPEIAQEFIDYLHNERGTVEGDPPFLLELAHYEWVELGLMISQEEDLPPSLDPNGDPFSATPVLSPVVWNLTYDYPVHRIGPDFQPDEPEPVHLVVYRERDGTVSFLEINPVTQRLLQLLKENPDRTGREILEQIAQELNHPQPEVVLETGRELLRNLRQRNVILGSRA